MTNSRPTSIYSTSSTLVDDSTSPNSSTSTLTPQAFPPDVLPLTNTSPPTSTPPTTSTSTQTDPLKDDTAKPPPRPKRKSFFASLPASLSLPAQRAAIEERQRRERLFLQSSPYAAVIQDISNSNDKDKLESKPESEENEKASAKGGHGRGSSGWREKGKEKEREKWWMGSGKGWKGNANGRGEDKGKDREKDKARYTSSTEACLIDFNYDTSLKWGGEKTEEEMKEERKELERRYGLGRKK